MYAAKIEKCTENTLFGIYNEQRILKYLKRKDKGNNSQVPKIHDFQEIFIGEVKYYVMVTDLLGPSLKDL